MIVVAGFNSAIDKRVDVETLAAGAVNRALAVAAAPGGKGVNVARALGVLGSEVHLVGLIDAAQRDAFDAALRAHGVIFHGIAVPALRTCLAIRESDGRITELLEPGPMLDAATVAALTTTFRALATEADLAVLSGSLPPGFAADTYASLVRDIQARGVRCLVDSSGAALREALAAQPFLLKPNRDEATALRGRAVDGIDDAVDLVHTLRAAGVEMPVLSLGAQGALAVVDDALLHAMPPPVAARNPVGSGDCMLAGIAHALARGDAAARALRLGVACGAANAVSDDTGHIAADLVADFLPRVSTHGLTHPVPAITRPQPWRRRALP